MVSMLRFQKIKEDRIKGCCLNFYLEYSHDNKCVIKLRVYTIPLFLDKGYQLVLILVTLFVVKK